VAGHVADVAGSAGGPMTAPDVSIVARCAISSSLRRAADFIGGPDKQRRRRV
jgi:hypothetical protein